VLARAGGRGGRPLLLIFRGFIALTHMNTSQELGRSVACPAQESTLAGMSSSPVTPNQGSQPALGGDAEDSTEENATRSGLLLVVCGPSGVGKTTIVHAVQENLNGIFSISMTTRPQSDQEVDGEDYCFISDEQFQTMRDRDEFLEHATVFGRHSYGTPKQRVEDSLAEGRLIILDIDVQGALQVRQSMSEAFMIFILPPSEEELLRRLRSRGREDETVIQRRFAEAKHEINLARSSNAFDEFIVNDDLNRTIEDAIELVHKRWNAASTENP